MSNENNQLGYLRSLHIGDNYKMTRYPNNIKELANERDWSQADLARHSGILPQVIGRFWHGERRLNQDIAKKIADALGCSEASLYDHTEPSVSVVGDVGAGKVTIFDDHAHGAGLEEVPCPRGYDKCDIVAVRVRGDSMRPMVRDGYLLFYSKLYDGVPDNCLNEVCVVRIADDGMMVREVKQGSKPGHYHLIAYNGSTEVDVPVEWAAKIIEYRPR